MKRRMIGVAVSTVMTTGIVVTTTMSLVMMLITILFAVETLRRKRMTSGGSPLVVRQLEKLLGAYPSHHLQKTPVLGLARSLATYASRAEKMTVASSSAFRATT